MKKTREKKGITLIALIITIIVMLILVAVTLNIAIGDNGLVNKAKTAGEATTREIERETLLTAAVYASMNDKLKIEKAQDLIGNLPNEWQVVEKTNDYICTSPSGNIFEVTKYGQITYIESLQEVNFNISEVKDRVISKTENAIVIDAYGNSIKVPAGFKITNDADNVVDGIVVEDCTENVTKGSQFVWIPVGKIKIDSNETTVENPLERYSGSDDEKYGSKAIKTVEAGFEYECNVNTAETEGFISSVESNGGYYIGRYEARTADGQRGSADKGVVATDALTCKASDYLYNYVNYTDALRLSKQMYTGTVYSSNLVNSYAWDTALEYFETVTDAKTYSETPSINQGSESDKSNFYWQGTVGTATEDKICNVYDMASNSYEWTTEVHIDGESNVARGGVYSSTERYAGTRGICRIDTEGYHTLTFRVVLYLNGNKKEETEEKEEIIELPELTGEKLLTGNYIKKVGETNVVIPKGFGLVSTIGDEEILIDNIQDYETYITQTNISNGIVVKDSEQNEFVWIPVDNINSMVMCQTHGDVILNDNLQCPTCLENTKLAGKLYAEEKGENFEADLTGQKYEATSALGEPAVISTYDTQSYFNQYKGGTYTGDNMYQEEFDEMVKSVAKYGGFYVGRYETGGFNESTVVSKPDRGMGSRGDINGTSWYKMYKMQKDFGDRAIGSSMIWGCQYDQVMKFVNGKNGFNVTESDSANRHSGSSTTGAGNTTADFAANIYDLEDNMCEWTMECYNGTSRVMRGGGYKKSYSASNRAGHEPTNSNSDVGSRMTLYIKDLVVPVLPEKLAEGSEFEMDADGDGIKETWIVLYDGKASHLNEDEIEVISKNTVGENLELGKNDTEAIANATDINGNGAIEEVEIAIYSYNNAINRLNNYCDRLIEIDNLGVRSVGSKPSEPYFRNTSKSATEDTRFTSLQSWKNYGIHGEAGDTNLNDDYNKMDTLGIIASGDSKKYWLASRKVQETWENFAGREFNGKISYQIDQVDQYQVDQLGKSYPIDIWLINQARDLAEPSISNLNYLYVRPVIKLHYPQSN